MQSRDDCERGDRRVDTWCSVRCKAWMLCPGQRSLETSALLAICQTEMMTVGNISAMFESKSFLILLFSCYWTLEHDVNYGDKNSNMPGLLRGFSDTKGSSHNVLFPGTEAVVFAVIWLQLIVISAAAPLLLYGVINNDAFGQQAILLCSKGIMQQ